MKKRIALIFIAVLMLVLSSCTPKESNPLDYQTYPFSAKGSLSANEIEYVFEVNMTDKNTAELMFSSPDSLRGYTFNVSPEGTTLSYGDMTIDFSNNGEKTSIVNLVPALFSLNSENFVSKSETTQNSVELITATYTTDNGEITVYINKSTGHPMRFEYGSTVINITEFIPITPSTALPTPTTTPAPTATSISTPIPTPTPEN